MRITKLNNIITASILTIPLLFLITIFLGFNPIHLSNQPYNNWRLGQVVILSLSLFVFLLFIKINLIKVKKINLKLKTILLILPLLLFASIYNAHSPMHAVIDLLLYINLMSYLVILLHCWSYLKESNQKIIYFIENGLAITALAPFYICILCLSSYYILINYNIDYTKLWHNLFFNIRYYNDTLLPCLFLLWFKPGFLKKYSTLIILISSCYLLTLWLDAARAVWLGIIVGLLFIPFYYKAPLKELKIPVISLILSCIFYFILIMLIPDVTNYNVLRETTSGRLSMWIPSIKSLFDHYGVGIGGANFIFNENINVTPPVGHLHNVILQFLVEWGFVGFVFVFYIGYLFIKNFFLKNKIPVLLSAGSIAIIINMLLSGAGIYPQSQMAIIIFFAYTLQFNFVSEKHDEAISNNIFNQFTQIIILLSSLLLLIYSLTNYNKPITKDININQNKIIEEQTYCAPRYWIDAKFILKK